VSDRPATAQIRRLRGVTWQWRDDVPEDTKREPGMGVIAQEVQAVFPHLIEVIESGTLRVDYGGLALPISWAVRELHADLRTAEHRTATAKGKTMSDENIERLERIGEAATEGPAAEIDPDRLAKVFPELVTVAEDGEPEIAYHSLIGLLIESVRELDDRLGAVERALAADEGPAG
jgi:hypothetical protein